MTESDFSTSNFAANLQLAASYYPSVSALCRKLQINRQQFMKYLAGNAFPSRHNMRRICDFLGVDEYEILMPQDQFRTIVSLQPNRELEDLTMPKLFPPLLRDAQRHQKVLAKLNGYYYQYYLSFSTTEKILRSLVFVYTWQGYTLYKRIERLNSDGAVERPDIYKYSGMITIAGDRMHLIDVETITGSELTHTSVFMNYRNRVSVLTGLTMGVSGADGHEPSASRVVLEFIGRTVDRRRALSRCQLYPIESTNVSKQVRDYLIADERLHGPLQATSI